jgi:hypothetical protein
MQGGGHPANEMLGNIRYIRSAIAMHRHRAPNRPSIHRLFRQNRFFSSPQICDVGGLLANALSGLSQIPNLARVEVSGGSSKIYDSSHNLGTCWSLPCFGGWRVGRTICFRKVSVFLKST